MKKLSMLFLILALSAATLVGCQEKKVKEAASVNKPEDKKTETPKPEDKKAETPKTEEKKTETKKTETKKTETPKQDRCKAVIYSPNENADGYTKQELTFEMMSAELLVGQLVGNGTLSDSVLVLNFTEDEVDGKNVLSLNLSQRFAEFLNSQDAASEKLTMGCIVNTFLDTFQATGIEVLVEGMSFTTNNAEYSGYLSHYAE